MSTLLLIDEEAYLLRHFVPAAETAGYQVQGTANLEEGVRLARRLKPDVILLNVIPPDGIGTLLCQEVKTEPVFAGTSVMFFSNESPSSDGSKLSLPEADEYVPKPISNRDILARVHLLLRLKKAEQQVVQAHLDIRHKQHTLQMMQQELFTLRQQQRQPAPPMKEEKPAEPEKPDIPLVLPAGFCRLNKFSMIQETNPITAGYLNLSGATGVDTLFADYVLEEDVGVFFEHLMTVFETGVRQTCEFRVCASNGGSRDLLAESVIVPKTGEPNDECVMVLTDITAYTRRQRRAEQQLPASTPTPAPVPVSASEAFPVQAILEAVDEGITVTDASGQIILMNSQMEKLTGYTKDETKDREAFLTLLYPNPEHYQRALSGVQATLLNGRTLKVDTLIRAKDGTLKSLTVSLYRVHVQHEDWVLSAYRERSMTSLLKPDLVQRRKLRPKKTSGTMAQFPRRQEISAIPSAERKLRPAEPVRQIDRKVQPADPIHQFERTTRPAEPGRQFGRKTKKERKKKALCVS